MMISSPKNQKNTLVRLAFSVISVLTVGCASIPTAPSPLPPLPPTSATAGTTTIVAIAAPAAPAGPQTNLLDCLGITAIGKCVRMELGRIAGILPVIIPGFNLPFGELANTPPVLPINDPQNLQSSNPAVAAAAAAKREEDAAPQKIAALKYLATRGCSSCNSGTEEALLSGLDDCTESVRFATATALYDAAGRPNRVCKSGNCCSPKIRQKLWEIGYKQDDAANCPIEPSPRVRRASRLALLACGCDCSPLHPPAPTPLEGPDGAPDELPIPPIPLIPAVNQVEQEFQ